MNNSSYLNSINQMCQNNSFENMSKCALFNHIQTLSFTIDDLRLFLDTHPCDAKALSNMNTLMKLREQAVKIYTKKYGPICSYDVDIDCNSNWTWNDYPMGWERGGR